jgi:O-antigen ligase
MPSSPVDLRSELRLISCRDGPCQRPTSQARTRVSRMPTDSPERLHYFANEAKPPVAEATAIAVTTAAFAKIFLPFYLFGSTAIFAVTSALGVTLIAVSWRPLYDMASKVTHILLLLGIFYGFVIAHFLFYSWPTVPTTHLFGILIFHALFMIFGFAAARALKPVLVMFLIAAAIYSIIFVRYIVRFGALMQDGYLNDILGVGDRIVFIAFQQKIGIMFGLAALAALGLASNRIKQILAIGTLPLALLVIFYIEARGALAALVCSLIFLAGAAVWARSKTLALLSVISVTAALTLASSLFYHRALQDNDITAVGRSTISRTIQEIRNPTPGLRLEIWSNAWHQISTEPDRLLFGRGIGMYPVNEGVGPPDWLLHKTIASQVHPHNVHLEMLYETGIVGLLLFSIIALFPLVISLRYWSLLSLAQKSAVSMYVFHLVGSEFSGSFAFQYLDQFFFALTVGIVALKRIDNDLVPALAPPENLEPRYSAHVRS